MVPRTIKMKDTRKRIKSITCEYFLCAKYPRVHSENQRYDIVEKLIVPWHNLYRLHKVHKGK